VAEHFNAFHEQQETLYQTAKAFVNYARQVLNVSPLSNDFSEEFNQITQAKT